MPSGRSPSPSQPSARGTDDSRPAGGERARLERDHDCQPEHGHGEEEVAHHRERVELQYDGEAAQRDLRDQADRDDAGDAT